MNASGAEEARSGAVAHVRTERSPLVPALILGLALALVVLWPAWLSPLTVAPGHETIDVWTHAWGLGWVYECITTGHLPVSTMKLGFPRGGTITPADPLGGILVAPFTALGGPALGYQAEAFLQVMLAGAAGFLYGAALGGTALGGTGAGGDGVASGRAGRDARLGSAVAGVFAGVVCATSPTFTAELHNGILEANWIGLVPLAGLAAFRGSRWTGLWVGLAALGSPYHGVSAAVLATVHLVAGGRIRAVPRMLALSLIGAIPAFLSLRAGLSGAEPLEVKPPGIQEPTLRINALDPRAFFRPGDYWTVRLSGPDVPNFRRTSYLGFVLLGTALLGLVRARRVPRRALLVVPVVVGAVCALGAWVWWGDDWLHPPHGAHYALPFAYVLRLTNGGLDHPLRLLGMTIVALAGLGAAGIGALGARAWTAGVGLVVSMLVLVENLHVAPHVWPIATSDMRIPSVYAQLPDDGRAIVDLPAEIGESMGTGRYVYWASVHGRPVPYTLKPSARVPSMNPALRTWLAIGTRRSIPAGMPGWIDPASDMPAAVRELAEQGFGWVVLHPELCGRDNPSAAFTAVLDPLLGVSRAIGETLVWEIPR